MFRSLLGTIGQKPKNSLDFLKDAIAWKSTCIFMVKKNQLNDHLKREKSRSNSVANESAWSKCTKTIYSYSWCQSNKCRSKYGKIINFMCFTSLNHNHQFDIFVVGVFVLFCFVCSSIVCCVVTSCCVKWMHASANKSQMYHLELAKNGVHATKFMLIACNLNILAHHCNLIAWVDRCSRLCDV